MNDATDNLAGIAIVGMAGRFPKARNLDEFWRNLCAGVEAISFFNDDELADLGGPTKSSKPNYVKARAILEDADRFDAAFFGMNPREAELTDPQHRLFLEAAWEALEDANCDPQKHGEGIGVFAGMSTNTYLANNLAVVPQLLIGINGEFQAMVGNERDYLTTRVSYKLNLRGPSLNVQTACSTSLVAVSLACQHLLTYQCNLALAGAVSVSFPQKRGYLYQEGGITSPDGHCRPFDANSAGTVAGDGVGVVALKRLEDALKDGDAIYAVIKGFGTNNDGALKIGYTAPSVQGQADVIALAQAMAGFAPETISYVEAHGTGTPLGDPIEIEGLTRAFRLGTQAKQFCAIGSVKGNIGHLDTAAGIAGLIKTALALRHKTIPPSLHFVSPNPKINFADSPFRINHELTDWKSGATPRRAGISSFGIGGTNSHIVLEEAPAPEPSGPSRPVQLLLFSARTKPALQAVAQNLANCLAADPDIKLADVAYTLQTSRRPFEQRAFLTCREGAEAAAPLKTLAADRVFTGKPLRENPPVVFMFPGQGAQHADMGRQLYESEPVFERTVDHCCKILEPQLGFDLRTVLYPAKAQSPAAPQASQLRQTAVTQPAMFVIEYALAQLWLSWGVQPAAMIGHSLGEYVAACVAGVFSLDDALALIAARGRMMQDLPAGMMLAVRLPESEVKLLVKEPLAIAAVNAATGCVVSGPAPAVEAFRQQLAARNVVCIPLQTSHAFHSAMMDPVLAPFAELVRKLKPQPPKIPFISNVTGTWITDAQAVDPGYWASHARQTVRFADGLAELFKTEQIFLEVGPGQTLAGLARQHSQRKAATPIIASLEGAKEGDLNSVLSALGQLWLNGVAPAWEKFYGEEKRRRVRLPTYPFERKRFWVEPPRGKLPPAAEPGAGAVETTNGRAGKNDFTQSDAARDLVEVLPPGGYGVGARTAVSALQRQPPDALAADAVATAEDRRTQQPDSETRARLRALISSLSGFDPNTLDTSASFTQLGFDSLFLTQVAVAVERDFGVRVAFRQLLEEFSTLDSLAAHIERQHPANTPPPMTENGNGGARSDGPGRQLDTVVTAPLTESQREIWFASQLGEAASCVYNECRLLQLRGPLQADVLRDAVQRLVARHEALRATFPSGGEIQEFQPVVKVEVPLADWSPLEAAERESRLDAAQIEEARQPFDLLHGPLIRSRLIRLASEHHVLVITVHHLVCDGYSFGILLRELGESYSEACQGKETAGPPPLQFREYAKLQAERKQRPEHAADEAYWLDQFAAGAPVLELPTDQPRVVGWQFDGARLGRPLPQKLGDDLKRLSAENGCTLFTTLFAAYALLLCRLSRQQEIVIGVPLADRAIPRGETLVGHCVNFLPLRGSINPRQPFAAHLAAMQKVFLSADEHGHYTLGSLLQKLSGSRDPSRLSLVSATFNLDRVAGEPTFAGLEAKLADNAHSAASFDINVDVIERRAGLQLNCRYNAGLFRAETIQGWLAHFQTLLEHIVADPQRLVGDLPLLTELERNRILVEWNQTNTDYPRDQRVQDIFEEQAAKTPHAVAAEFEGTRLTYGELNERANRLAHYLQRAGVGSETIVAVCLDRSLEMIVTLLGILKAGGTYMALDPSHPKERLELMLEEAEAPVVVTQEKHRPFLPGSSRKEHGAGTSHELAAGTAALRANPAIICLDSMEKEIDHQQATNPASQATAESPAYVSFTSGSTGKPKGVCIPHRAILRLVKHTNYASFAADEVFLQLAPLTFDASTLEIWGPLLNGARLVVFSAHPPSLSELGEFIQKRGITTLWLTSGLFHQMIEEQTAALRGLRQLLAGGDVLAVPQVKRALAELPNCRLINGYGPTENTTFTCCHQITNTSLDGPSIPIGRPIANTQVYLLDEAMQPVPIGVPGELYAGGDGLACGYLNRPELTAEKFIPNPFSEDAGARLYKTGDLARWLPDGNIQFLGRLDTQVKIRGNRVEPGEIEAVLGGHPAVRECVVVAQNDRSGEKVLAAYFAAVGPAQPAKEELREHIRRALPDYMIPSAFVRLPSLPLTASGKVDRKTLPRPKETDTEAGHEFVAASNETERRLAEIWQEVLGQSRVGTTDDFFELGGHSLLALRLIARVETAFGKQIPVASVFHARTVAQMAALLRDNSPPRRSTSIVEIQPLGSRPPLMLVHGAGGGMFWGYSALAEHLGADQPVYGFKSRDADDCQFASLKEMARYYVADLKVFQPHGPYRLGGYCFGGNVAYEMAQELGAQGEEVALLVLINCMPPNSSYDRARFSAAFCARFLKNLMYWGNYVLHLKRGRRREFLGWKLRTIKSKILHMMRRSGAAPLNVDIEDFVDLTSQPEGRRGLWEAHVHALFKHRHEPYASRITLLRTQGHTLLCSFDESFGWSDLAPGGVTVRIVPGAHESIMDEPHVQSLAKELRECLDESNAETQVPNEETGAPPSPVPSLSDPIADGSESKCIHQMFEEQAARTPNAAALVLRNDRMTYADLNRRADELAGHLRFMGIGPDVPVGICLERSFEMVIGMLAILKAGGAYVPLDPAYPEERLKLMVENSRIPVLLTQTSMRSNMQFGIPNLKLLCLDEPEFKSDHGSVSSVAGLKDSKREAVSPVSLAYIIHTSGSTGAPKGVAIEHRQAVNFIRWAQETFSREELAGVLFSTSICFDLSVFELFVTLSTGGKVIIARNALGLADLPAKNEVTLINTVPSAAAELVRLKAIPPGVQVINLAGEPLKTPLVDKLYALGTLKKVHDLYGPSETTTYSTYALRQAGAPATIGKPILNTQVHLLDDHRQPVPAGEIGEIFIGGAGVARGYLHRPDLTAERFVPDPFQSDKNARLYKTGDLARWRPDGNLDYLGRIDHQIKIRGYRVELGEIETVLTRHPAVGECAVIAREDTPGEKRLVAYVVQGAGNAVGQTEFRTFLQAKLPEYMVPSAFVPLEKLPLTPNGKLDRKKLPEPDRGRPEGAGEFVAPSTPIEKKIAEIWFEVLGWNQIGVSDNFFELGGDSLLAVQVVSRLRQAFGVELPVAAMFETPTIAKLAEGLGAARWGAEGSAERPITPAPREGKIPLSFSQQRLWFIDQLSPGNVAYNMPVAVRLEGSLDQGILQDCLNDIVRRHEMLRTTFTVAAGEPEQTILANISLELPLVDLSGLPAVERESEAQRRMLAEAQRPFDLARGPLIRAKLLRLDSKEHLLLVVMQHIISDGWSLDVFLKELAALLEQKTTGTSAPLPELPIQYADYAVWQHQSLTEESLSDHLGYWKKTLAGAPPSLKLPADREVSPETAPAAARSVLTLSKETAESLQNLNRQSGSTSFMTLLGALMVTLNRWTRQADIVAGTVSAGRTRRETEALIGCFMNFLPIRSVLRESDTGLEILAGVKEAVLNAHAHLDCPFEKIVEAVNPDRGSSPSPIYNVGFLLENFPKNILTTQHLKGTLVDLETNAALLDLRFIADESASGITLTCEYRKGLFEAKTIEDLLASFGGVLATLIQKPETKLAEFALTNGLEEQSRKRRLPPDNITITATFTAEPLAEPLEFWLRELELPAQVKFAPYNQLFQELLDPASVLSRNARGMNVVLVRMEDWAPPSENHAVSDFPRKVEQTLGDMVSALRSAAARSAVQFLLCICPSPKALARDPLLAEFFGRMHQKVATELASAPNVQLVFPEQLAAMYPADEFYDPRSDELGHVPYTLAFFTALATIVARKFNSQKRPAPKAIVLDCDQTLWAGVCGEDGPDGIQLSPPHRALQEFMRAQSDAGRLLCICSKNNPEDVQAVFERHKEMPLKTAHFAATRANWLPKSANLKSLAQELNLGLESFVLVDDNPIECAEVQANCPGALALLLPESPELIPQFLKHCWIFDQHTATAEDKLRTEFYRQERERAQAQTDSMSLPEFHAKLDLKVRIAELSPGDLPRAAQLTHRTNQFNCTTRRRTEAEIQEVLRQDKALVVFASDRFGDYGLVGLVICKFEPEALNVDTFLLSCRALGRGVEHTILAYLGSLAKSQGAALVDVHFVASEKNKPALEFLESVGGQYRQALNGGYVFRFPADVAAGISFHPQNAPAAAVALTSSSKAAAPADSGSTFDRWRWIALEASEVGKIQALIEAKAGVRKIAKSEPDTAPRTEAERELCRIWQELLRVDHIGIRDNFFELGGHSLLAVRLFAQIEKRLKVKLPIITVFQSPTIEQLAKAVEQQASQSAGAGLLPIQSKGSRPPLFLVHGAGGDVLWGYANLAHHTDRDQPIYGIQACGEEEFSTLEDMAAHYVEKVRAYQPVGPYYLGGYCFGGNVAQEMARQLEAQGERVAVLALLDCAPSNCGYESLDWRRPTLALDFTRNLMCWLKDFAHLEPAQRRSLVLRKLRILPGRIWGRISGRHSPQDFDLEEFIDVTNVSERETRLWNNHLGLLVRHVSKPYGGPLSLFRTRGHPLVCSYENDFGWRKLAPNVTVKNIPGSHEGIFMEPHVRGLAAELEQSLRPTSSVNTSLNSIPRPI